MNQEIVPLTSSIHNHYNTENERLVICPHSTKYKKKENKTALLK